jgi:tRNA(Ile)-lysidine synthase
MAGLGPFEPTPRLAVAVSGGADSMALALLAYDWARARGGSALALIVDHGLRAGSACEAVQAAARLASRGIAARRLALHGLTRGTGLAERARSARYRALTEACADAGILHLLLGHHAQDQAETVLIRDLAGSGPDGLAGMAALVELPSVRLLRPLLGLPPVWLRDLLRDAGMAWAEDPSNADPAAQRGRLRALRRDRGGAGVATRALVDAAADHAAARTGREAAVADVLGRRARIYAEGFAVLSPGALPPEALGALLRTIAGAAFPLASDAVAALAAAPRPATLGGVLLLAAGRMGEGWLLVREAAAMQDPIEARPGALWDGRFRLPAGVAVSGGTTIGAVGTDAAMLRSRTKLPAAVLATLPALRRQGALVAVPHICYSVSSTCVPPPLVFAPARAVAPAPFLGAGRMARASMPGQGASW